MGSEHRKPLVSTSASSARAMNTGLTVRRTLEQLVFATARDVADELDISVSTARRHLETLVASGVATVRSSTGFSDMGRQATVNEYAWAGE